MTDDRLMQDEPGKGARGLVRWFASRLNARRVVREAFAHPCPNGHCKLGIDGKLSERCIVGCWKAMKEGIPK